MLLSRSKRSCSGLSLIGFSKTPLTGTTPLLPKVGHPSLQVAGISAGMRPIGNVSRKKKPYQSSSPRVVGDGHEAALREPVRVQHAARLVGRRGSREAAEQFGRAEHDDLSTAACGQVIITT